MTSEPLYFVTSRATFFEDVAAMKMGLVPLFKTEAEALASMPSNPACIGKKMAFEIGKFWESGDYPLEIREQIAGVV
jgi:hypothetical protein